MGKVIPIKPSYAIFNPELRSRLAKDVEPICKEKSEELVGVVENAICSFFVQKAREVFTQVGEAAALRLTEAIDRKVMNRG